jgi:hypothetical protein
MKTENGHRPAYFLGLQEIAAWQLKNPVHVLINPTSNDHEKPLFAELPALQRGSVWSASQTESLWDSLIRGFPVGSFFFAPYQAGFGREDYKLGKGSRSTPDFLLLDGQQRATAIALGFLDLWSESQEYVDGPALWVDLRQERDGERDGDREFVFRLLTRSHPWGYDRIDPKKRLAQGDIRNALQCFNDVGKTRHTAAALPLRHAWPWDAVCPVPAVLLLASIGAADPCAELSRRLRALPIWRQEAKLKGGGNLADSWDEEVAAFQRGCQASGLERIMTALRRQLELKRIPALVLPSDEAASTENAAEATQTRRDEVETLFVRVNSAGTPLAGEELIYSSLKAAWPEAPEELKNLQPERQITTRARLVSLLWRLHLAFPDEGIQVNKALPGTPSVTDFRKAMRDSKKRENFLSFVRNPDLKAALDELVNWVRIDVHSTSGNANLDSPEAWRLPPTLAAQLFSGDRGLDVLFIAVAWIKCLQRNGHSLDRLTEHQRKRSLGFLVAVHWFAERPTECVSRLWHQLQDRSDLANFFNAERFRSLLDARSDGGTVMLPLIPPHVLEGVIKSRVSHDGKDFPNVDNEFWNSGSRWEHFYGRLAPKFSMLDDGLREWLKTLDVDFGYGKVSTENGAESDLGEHGERLRQIWDNFLDKIWGHRPLVDYAQREWLARWFPDFDPTLPGQMEDLNRPWDYDHIHPSSHIVKNVPAVIREWHQSIGNLRAWPLELNRGDQDDSPAAKMLSVDAQFDYFFGRQPEDLRLASFISEPSEWVNWQAAVPTPLINKQYLKLIEGAPQRHALLLAITHRFCRLYREWYEGLALGDL